MGVATNFELPWTGSFSFSDSVAAAADAGFVDALREVPGAGPALDVALLVDGTWEPVGVTLRAANQHVRAEVVADPRGAPRAALRGQLLRMLALDVDAAGFEEVCARDDVLAGLAAASPGLRPVGYPSPYEAAIRTVVQHRLGSRQAAAVTARIAADHGTPLEVGDRVLHTLPAPEQLARLPQVRGLAARKVDQLRALGAAAVSGRLAGDRLRSVPAGEAMADLQGLPGIGPFSAELVLIRGAGDPDLFPRTELSLHRAVTSAYGLDGDAGVDQLERVADRWRPYRSWAGLLLRHRAEEELRRGA